MREILFRGKLVDDGEWVYGSFCMDACEQFNGLCGVDGFIRLYSKAEGKMQMHEVDRETVGQFTGLTDKNGKKIFEGDILRRAYYPNEDVIVEWHDGAFRFMRRIYPKEYGYESLCCNQTAVERLRIIGNIFDNPELLED